METKVKITRRSKFKACISFTSGQATLAQCETMTAKKFMREYSELKQANPNASVFIDVFVKGRRVNDPAHVITQELNMLDPDYGMDEIYLSVE